MLTENYTYEDELNHQREQNTIYTKQKIIMFKLIDLKQNLYFSKGLKYHDHMLNKIKKNLVNYEHRYLKYKKQNARY